MKISMNGELWNRLMRAAKAVTDKTGDRPVLSGVYVEVEGDVAMFTCLDGYMLSHWEVMVNNIDKDNWNAIIPVFSLSKPKSADIIQLSIEGDKATVTNVCNGMSMELPLIQGEYLEYKKVIPGPRDTETEVEVFFNTGLLKSVLEATEGVQMISVSLTGNKVQPMILKGKNEIGRFTGLVLPVRTYSE